MSAEQRDEKRSGDEDSQLDEDESIDSSEQSGFDPDSDPLSASGSDESGSLSLERLSLNSSAPDPSGVPNQDADPSLVAALQAEVKEHYDKYLRAVADLENFKKRSIKERSELLKYSGEGLAKDLLEVVDNLERAISLAPAEGGPFVEGVRLVLTSFVSILDRQGIRGESGVGQRFDPTKHEALATVPTADHAAGHIIEEYRKAYFYKDKLLRVGQVVVASQPN